MGQQDGVTMRQQANSHSSVAASVPSLDRGLTLLRVLAATTTPLTLSELSDMIGVPRSTVYSLLATLHNHGMVEKDPRYKTYRLGVATLELGSAYLARVSLVPVFNEVAQQLVGHCHETVKLAVLDGRDVVYIGKQEGLYSIRLVARVGTRMPAHATAVGKVLLSQLSDDELDILYTGYAFSVRTPHTIAAYPELLHQIAAARLHSYAYDNEESALGVRCVAGPIYGHTGAMVAAISIGVPSERLGDDRLTSLRTLLLDHAQEISRRLGWTERDDSEAKYANP